ncbi:MAG: Stp1/IreP family PP2C-type Ser/Thr phosphatase [Actinomycetota bacterium]
MRFDVGVISDIGQVRERNEDSFLVAPPLYAVADGMGGHRGGEVASGLALETVEALANAGEGALTDQVREANRAVFERSMTDRAVSGMGTTLTALTVDDDAAHVAHVGDSRAYLLRAGALRQLTEDHTLVNRMVKAGEISPEEAEVHPHRNVVTRALGTEPDVQVDRQDVPLLDGERLLLCSDGLTNMVTTEQIRAILEANPSPQDAATRLVRAANRAGGIDNITVIVVDAHGDDVGGTGPATGPGGASGGATARPPRRRGVPGGARRWVVGIAVAAVALLALIALGRSYLDRQWYVGESNGNVAIFRGIPAELAGLRFSRLQVETDIPAAEASALPVYARLAEGITANDREEAQQIVEQIRQDVDAARAAAASGDGP